MGFLSGSGLILLVCVLVGLGLVVRRRTTGSMTSIGAEKFVADIVENSDGPTGNRSGSLVALPEAPSEHAPIFRLNYGRVSLFGLALVLIIASLITGVLALMGKIAGLLPLLLFLASVGCLAGLRVLALRDRDRRRARTVLALEQKQARRRPSLPQEPSSARTHQQSQRAATLELKPAPQRPARARQQMPVSHAAKALRKVKTQHPMVAPTLAPASEGEARAPHAPARLRMDEALPDNRWQVTAVPLPTYLQAETARRPAPAPLEIEVAPQSQTQTLAEAATLNLDDVLKRRRA